MKSINLDKDIDIEGEKDTFIFSMFDGVERLDNATELDFETFLAFVSEKIKAKETYASISYIFNLFDVDKTGYISS